MKTETFINYIILVKKEDGNYFLSTGVNGTLTKEIKTKLEKLTNGIVTKVKQINKDINK